jgi:hypothetical protein
MGIATSRTRTAGNRHKIIRFGALFGLFAFMVSTLIVTFSATASALPGTYDWANDATIIGKGEPVGWIPDKPTASNTTYIDSNPNDTNRTFKAQLPGGSWCKDGLVDTITLFSPTSGTWNYVATRPSSDFGLGNKNAVIPCEIKTAPITIGSIKNGEIESQACTQTGPDAEARCAAQREKGNKEWVRLCNYVGVPGAPSPPAGSFCGDFSGTPPPPGTTPPNTTPGETKKPPDPCDSLGEFSARWIACPILTASAVLAKQLDKLIEDNLHYDTAIFDRNTDKGKNYYEAWKTFRNIALALVLIAGLVMVVSQGTGMQLFDAYTVKKVMPRLLVAVIGITLCWPLLQFIVTFFNDMGHWIQDIILLPFQGAAKSTNSSTGAEIAGLGTAITGGFLGATAAVIGLGAGGIMTLIGTIVLALVVGLLVIMARNVVITVVILFAPLAIACYILPNTKKVFDFWQNALVTCLIMFLIVMALIGAGHAMALTTEDGLMKVLLFIMPYFFLPFAAKLAGGLMNTIFGVFGDKTKGAFAGLRNKRKEIVQGRMDRLRDGGLGGGHAFMKPVNFVGKRWGAAREGGGFGAAFLNTSRARQARSLHSATIAERALKRNAFLNQLQNDDDGNAVLAGSGGTLSGAEAAARDLFTDEKGVYNSARGNKAISAARAAGLNHANSLAALQTTMRNKARSFGAGNVRALDNAVHRNARSQEEYESLAYSTAYHARESGRLDLGGTGWVDYRKDGDTWDRLKRSGASESQQWKVIADKSMLDGIGRSGVHSMMTGHTNQATQAMSTLTRMLKNPSSPPEVRLQAALALKEFHGALPGASGDVRDAMNKVMYGEDSVLKLKAAGNIAEQLAEMSGYRNEDGQLISGQALTTMGRTYSEYVNNPYEKGIAAGQEH